MRSFQSELIRNGLLQARAGEVEQVSTRTSGKPKERERAELMGTNRQTYKRVNRAVRRR